MRTFAQALRGASLLLIDAIFMCFARLLRVIDVSFFHSALFWIAVSVVQVCC